MNSVNYLEILIVKRVILTVNFNINLLKLNERELFSEFFDNLLTHGFLPKITFPTRFTRNNGTLIYNLFCKFSHTALDTKSGIFINKLSDHQSYFTNIQPIANTHKPIHIHTSSELSLHKTNIAVFNSNIDQKLNHNILSDPNINYNIPYST